MNWKNLTIGKKIAVGYTVILILLIVVSVMNYFGVGSLVGNAEEVIDGNKLSSLLAQKETDHLKWVENVNALLTDPNVTTLEVQTDDHKCSMGKWLYGEERKESERILPGLAPILKSLEGPHRELHETAIAIGDVYKEGDVTLPAQFISLEAAHLAWANRAYEAIINKATKIKQFQTDPNKCKLGKFMRSEQGLKAYNNGSPGFKELWDAIHPSHNAMHEAGANITTLLANNQFEEASQILQQQIMLNLNSTVSMLQELRLEAEDELLGMKKAQEIYATKTIQALHSVQDIIGEAKEEVRNNSMTDQFMLASARSTQVQVAIVAGITLVIGLLLAFFTARGIVTLLSGVVKEMGAASEQVTGAASQISESSQALAEGASEQAATLEETSSSLEEMASLTRQNADNAKQADSIMGEARDSMETADSSMKRLTESMTEISSASEETQKIVKTIDEIAFQTNLLALNAAVEAARAGEAGAGFAVVADEVRSLAMRAADSARDTSNLIDSTVEKIKDGNELVTETSEMFHVAAESSERVSTLITEIATASDEQATGIEQINRSVTEIDKVTQSNAAGAEETASASEELTAQAAAMDEVVDELEGMVGLQSDTPTSEPVQTQPFHNTPSPKEKTTTPPAKQMLPASEEKKENKKPTTAAEAIPFDDDDFQDF